MAWTSSARPSTEARSAYLDGPFQLPKSARKPTLPSSRSRTAFTSAGPPRVSNQFSVITRTPCSLPRRPSSARPATAASSTSGDGLPFPGDHPRPLRAERCGDVDPAPDPGDVALAVDRVGDVAIVDEQRLQRHVGVGESGAERGEEAAVVGRNVERTDLDAGRSRAAGWRRATPSATAIPVPRSAPPVDGPSSPGALG